MKPTAAVRRHRRYPISNFGGACRYVSVQDVDFRKNAHPFGRGGAKIKMARPAGVCVRAILGLGRAWFMPRRWFFRIIL